MVRVNRSLFADPSRQGVGRVTVQIVPRSVVPAGSPGVSVTGSHPTVPPSDP
jgi:hypothetical protein